MEIESISNNMVRMQQQTYTKPESSQKEENHSSKESTAELTKRLAETSSNKGGAFIDVSQVNAARKEGKENRESKNQNSNQQQDTEGQNIQEVPAEKIKSAITNVNKQMKQRKTQCEFSYHEATKRISIKVIDKDTEKVIKEIPPEETLDAIAKMWEVAGILVDEKR